MIETYRAFPVGEKTVNQRYKVELSKRKMKLRMYPFLRKGVINWSVKMFRKFDLNWLVSIKKEKIILEVAVPLQ